MSDLDVLMFLDTNWNRRVAITIQQQFNSENVSTPVSAQIDNYIQKKLSKVSKEMNCQQSKNKLRAMLWWYHVNVDPLTGKN